MNPEERAMLELLAQSTAAAATPTDYEADSKKVSICECAHVIEC